MKKIYLIIASMFLTLACKDELELLPQQSLDSELAFSNAQTSEGVLIGAYNLLQDLHVLGSQPQIMADYQADNVNFVGTFSTLQEVNNFTVTAANGSFDEIYQDTYEAILAANAVINNVPNVESADLDEELKAQLVGEAQFIRALCYFNLINLYAQPYQFAQGSNLGVPIVLESSTLFEPFALEDVLVTRATVSEVHDQIIADLEAARASLPEAIEQGRASSVAATALLSRLRLYRGEWQEAADLSGEVVASERYTLAPDYSFYSAISPELIFTIENTVIDPENQADPELGSGSWDNYYEPSNQGGRGDCPFSQNLMDDFMAEEGDLRFELKETGPTFSGVEAVFTTKFNNGTTDESDPPILRVSEMYLNRAEALAELNGITQESIDLVNQIRARAGLAEWTTTTFASAEEYLEAIATERRKELAFEGHRRMDLLRRNKPLRTEESIPESAAPIGAGIGVTVGDPSAIFPIPQGERDINPGLEQNPGY